MKKSFVVLLLIVIGALLFWISQNTVMFVYLNPYTNTKSFPYIARTIKTLDKAFDYAKSSVKSEGYQFEYLYHDAYGSGFIEGNDIPNDLDYAVGIYLGEYDYDGSNAKEIATALINTLDAFQKALIFNVSTNENSEMFSRISLLDELKLLYVQHDKLINDIAGNIKHISETKNYVQDTYKVLIGENNKSELVKIPYVMKPNEILLENRLLLELYSDNVRYNKKMPKYLRGISIAPEVFVTINYEGKSYFVELVAESFWGARLQLKRRMYASNTFVHNFSTKFLKDLKYIKDDEEYFEYRMFSYKHHIQEIENILSAKIRPMKLFKRIRQSADIIYPLLDEEEYKEISDFVTEKLSDKNVVLMNEFSNILDIWSQVAGNPKLFILLAEKGQISQMYKCLDEVVNDMEKEGTVTKDNLKIIKDYKDNVLYPMSKISDINKLVSYITEVYNNEAFNFKEKLNNISFVEIQEDKIIDKIVKEFEDVYYNAGYHKITICWLGSGEIGIKIDDFTKTIDNFTKFVAENKLIEANYRLVPEEKINDNITQYDIYVRYNPTPKEEQNFKEMKQKLLDDRKNFKIKKKLVLVN